MRTSEVFNLHIIEVTNLFPLAAGKYAINNVSSEEIFRNFSVRAEKMTYLK